MKRDISTIIVGILFLAAGVLIGGNMLGYFDFDFNLAGWWTLFLIIPALLSMTQGGPNAGNTILLGIGTLLLLDQQRLLPRSYGLKLIFPLILLVVGLQILLGGNGFSYSKSRRRDRDGSGGNGGDGGEADQGSAGHFTREGSGHSYANGERRSGGGIFSSVSHPGEGHKKASVTFGGEDINYGEEEFLGGTFTAVFGGLTLNMVNVKITGDVVIDVSATFGGIEIILPRGVKVVTHITPVLGGSECKYPSSSDPAAPTVIVNGTASFGGIEIK